MPLRHRGHKPCGGGGLPPVLRCPCRCTCFLLRQGEPSPVWSKSLSSPSCPHSATEGQLEVTRGPGGTRTLACGHWNAMATLASEPSPAPSMTQSINYALQISTGLPRQRGAVRAGALSAAPSKPLLKFPSNSLAHGPRSRWAPSPPRTASDSLRCVCWKQRWRIKYHVPCEGWGGR